VIFNRVSVDFKISSDDEEKVVTKNNTFLIKGLYVEGGLWDKKGKFMKEENIQELIHPLPIVEMVTGVHSEVQSKLDPVKHDTHLNVMNSLGAPQNVVYMMPVYYIPIRGVYLGRNSYLMDLPVTVYNTNSKEGAEKSEREHIAFWTKKGTAILMSVSEI